MRTADQNNPIEVARRARRVHVLAAALACVLMAPIPGSPGRMAAEVSRQDKDAEKKDVTEYGAKADFLELIVKFVEWPKEVLGADEKELVIGILGPNPFKDELDALKKKTVKSKTIVVKTYDKLEDVKEKECHVLFIAQDFAKKVADVATALGEKSILLIGETKTSADDGTSIAVLIKEKKLVFEINLEAAKKAKLVISSKITKLASRVLKAK